VKGKRKYTPNGSNGITYVNRAEKASVSDKVSITRMLSTLKCVRRRKLPAAMS